MKWYWWVLIVAGVVGLVTLKIIYAPKWLKKQQEKKAARQKLAEDE
ncbi:MAG TPA: hypothetical protein PK629_06655 [Oscillospiraceae bacterium]|nr:hypothetical protein [Oscillospiraceae bacterium]HPF55315.1 hypothetical protein [Clostridiales bacterium]HPK36101.1 hypothetical protein [Oscillospiraceae bacterium]HPR76616.1 hypothetical protein [Oscillospiraceae bacterium]